MLLPPKWPRRSFYLDVPASGSLRDVLGGKEVARSREKHRDLVLSPIHLTVSSCQVTWAGPIIFPRPYFLSPPPSFRFPLSYLLLEEVYPALPLNRALSPYPVAVCFFLSTYLTLYFHCLPSISSTTVYPVCQSTQGPRLMPAHARCTVRISQMNKIMKKGYYLPYRTVVRILVCFRLTPPLTSYVTLDELLPCSSVKWA